MGLEIGSAVSRFVHISASDFSEFSRLSGDRNPIHTDEAFASKTIFGRRIAPGLLVASYISAVIANELPGPGSIYLEQNLRFCKAVFDHDDIEVRVVVVEIFKPGICRLSTNCLRQREPVVEGFAVVKYPLGAE